MGGLFGHIPVVPLGWCTVDREETEHQGLNTHIYMARKDQLRLQICRKHHNTISRSSQKWKRDESRLLKCAGGQSILRGKYPSVEDFRGTR